MTGIKSLLLLAVVYISGLITGSPITASHISPSEASRLALKAPAATVGVATRTEDPIDLGWLLKARESVVLVATPTGHGSGVCYDRVDKTDFILTARHVVRHGERNESDITIMGQSSGMDYQITGVLVRVSETYDLALVSVYDPDNVIHTSALASESPIFGDLVIAMGFPSDHYPVVSTIGFALGWVAWDAIYLNHSASIWFGNSGGPVFDAHGFIIGINVRIDGRNGRPDGNSCGAVPIEDIHNFLRR